MKGDKIMSTTMVNEMKHDYSIAGWPSGLYLIHVENATRTGTNRIVKID
jgi:hypothetical protein